ncbi:MAG: hypothetical protein K2Q26_15685 [Bdellovibrionales bacterium]|nr:hypothetical protein [Bdellovibrionales bacterium]
MLLKKFALYLIFTFFISGCSSMGMRGAISGDDRAKINKLAVVSLQGPQFQFVKVGTTTFDNDEQQIDAKDLKIDALVEATVVETLKKNGQFKKVGAISSPSRGSDPAAVSQLIKDAKAQGYDALMVILPANYSNAPLIKPGYGIYQVSNFMGESANPYFLAIARVYDTADETVMAWQWTFDSIGGKPNVTSDAKIPTKTDYANYTASEKADIQDKLKAHIKTCLSYTTKALNLN